MSEPNKKVDELEEENQALRRKLAQRDKLLESIFEGAPILMLRVDKEGRVVDLNHAISHAVGKKRDDLLGLLGGELLRCVNAAFSEGCGRGIPCKTCPIRTSVQRTFDKGHGAFREPGSLAVDGLGGDQYFHFLVTTALIESGGEGEVLVSLEDMTSFRRSTDVQAALLRVIEYSVDHSLGELLQKFLDEVEILTKSEIGFFHFLESDQNHLSLQCWSTNTETNFCTTQDAEFHYPVSQAGVWVDCIHERRPVIHNNYLELAHRKGLPPGHAPVIRELVLPIIRREKIVAIVGLGNKRTDYHERDVHELQHLADMAWETIERKQAEEQLHEIQRQHADFINTSSDLIAYWKMPDGLRTDLPIQEQVAMMREAECLDANRAFWELFGYSNKNDILGKKYRELVKPKQTEELFCKFIENGYRLDNVLIYEEAVGDQDYYGLDNWYGMVKSGMLTHIWGSSKNVTEQKRAEQALRQEKAFIDQVLNEQLDTLFLFDPHTGKALKWNRAFSQISGYTDEEIASLPAPMSYYDEEDLSRAKGFIESVLEHKSGVIELGLICKDGRKVPTEYQVSVISHAHDDGSYLISIGRDISKRIENEAEKVKLEEQLRQSQKMEAIGQLAGGIAHDFNNLLTVILSYAEYADEMLLAGHQLKMPIGQILVAGGRAAGLTRQLLAFSRRQVMAPEVLHLNDVVGNVDRMLRRLIGENIQLMTSLADDIGRIHADPGQIEQVLMNLAVNARDAMPDGGELTIETANVYLDESYAQKRPDTGAGSYVMMAVSDSGTGMDQETQRRIFEPFFTTKKEGKGTGLGLSTVYGIVKQSKGNIWVYSEPGEGTTFKVYLPRVETESRAPQKIADAPQTLNGSETILVVEDEPLIRDLANKMLTSVGYRVLMAENGEEAIRLCRTSKQEIHLVLTDVIMPKMSGSQLADEIAQILPQCPIIFMSGYTDDAIVHHGVLGPEINFIAKPFNKRSLLAKIRSVLDAQ